MKRSEMREQAFFLTFETLFGNMSELEELIDLYSENVTPVSEYAREICSGTIENRDDFYEIIDTYSKGWKVTRLPKTTLAILLVALYEMKFVEAVPDSVAINEAVELAKKYSTTSDASYINGILGAVSRGN